MKQQENVNCCAIEAFFWDDFASFRYFKLNHFNDFPFVSSDKVKEWKKKKKNKE